jgi:predicted TPR repeat methyltransferase
VHALRVGILVRMAQPSLDHAYFGRVYADTSDPWNFATSAYENDKYAATIDALGSTRFKAAFEIGCSIGVLTAMLAARCDALLSVDINERALEAARARCAKLPNVRFALMDFPHVRPGGRFDLIVLSEVAYYWSDEDLLAAVDFAANAASGGTLELVHFLPKVDDYVRDGDGVHTAFLSNSRFTPVYARRAEKYRIDVLHAR